MKNLRSIITGICFIFFSAITVSISAQSTTAKVDTKSSFINWMGKKVVGSHEGTIKLSGGELSFTAGKLTGGTFTIDMASMENTDMKGGGAEKLMGHLHSDDFFGTAAHPTSTLNITKVIASDSGYDITGDLTIKGITKPISFSATAGQYLANANITVDRTAYGIKYGSGSFFDNLGDKAIDNDFTLKVNLVLVN